jgi:hypothetical protein
MAFYIADELARIIEPKENGVELVYKSMRYRGGLARDLDRRHTLEPFEEDPKTTVIDAVIAWTGDATLARNIFNTD